MRHKYIGPIASDSTSRGTVWYGFTCERCGVVIRRTAEGNVLSWADKFGDEWNRSKLPTCESVTP